jgi:hypothetical protein
MEEWRVVLQKPDAKQSIRRPHFSGNGVAARRQTAANLKNRTEKY